MRRAFSMGLIAILFLVACVALAETPAKKALTVMVYMCGSNLETQSGSATADMDEMARSGFDADQVNLVVMAGGSRRWDRDLKSGEATTIRFFKKRGELKRAVAAPQYDVNMGDPATLTKFVRECVEDCPAESYALILWDHGAGPMEGVCYDELNDPDRLCVDELAKALASAELSDKLSWIGFDACLMSTLEMASKMAPYAEYMIASQEREPGSGWNYAFLAGIEGDGDGAATGARIIDTYLDYPLKTQADLTMACIDLSAVAGIEESLDAMYREMTACLDSEAFSRISKLRVGATGFGKGVENSPTAAGYDLVDIASLCACYAPENEEGARRVREAVERAVVAHGENLEGCCGISVYHPFRNQRKFTEAWGQRYEALDFCPGYSDYVKTYGRIMTGERLVRWTGLTDIQVSERESTVTLKITDAQSENLASARLVVLARNLFDEADDAFFRVFSTADVSIHDGLLVADYDGRALQIVDDAGITPLTGAISYSVAEDGRYLLKLYPIGQDGTRWERPVIATYEMDDAGMLALKDYSIYDELTGEYSSRVELDLSQLRGFTFLNDYRRPTANADGEWLAFDQWDEDPHTDMQMLARSDVGRTAFAPSFTLDLLRQEDLYAAYELTDTQGNVFMSAWTPLAEGGVQVYPSKLDYGEALPYVRAELTTSWENRYIALTLWVENASREERFYQVFDLKVDGREAVPYGGTLEGGAGSLHQKGGAPCLKPGEIGYINLLLIDNSFAGLSAGDVLEALSGTLFISANREDAGDYWVEFTAQADQPLDVVLHDPEAGSGPEDSVRELPLNMIGIGRQKYQFGSRVISQWGTEKDLSRIIVNIVVGNAGEEDMMFYLKDVCLNGVPVDVHAFSANGTGGESGKGRFSVAPGERAAAGLVLDYSAVSALLPEVSLRELSFTMAMTSVSEREREWQDVIPMKLTTEVPLDGFYNDAAALPSRNLVEAGIEMGAFDESTAQPLFSNGDCDVLLQGVFIRDRSFILLLRAENHSESERDVALGMATLDGREAVIGGTASAFLQARNARVRTRGLDKPLWQEGRGVNLTLKPGETQYQYVTVTPVADGQTEASTMTFQAYIHSTEALTQSVWFSEAIIGTEEPGPLKEGFEAIAPVEDYTIVPGTPITDAPAIPLFEETVQVPEGDPAESAIPIAFALPEDERMELGYYVLFRRLRSDAALADLNILNTAEGRSGRSAISFADGREWLLYEASGSLTVSGDGRTAGAIHPGLRPAILADGESLPLIDIMVREDGQGRTILNWCGPSAVFQAVSLPNAILPSGFKDLAIAWDPASGRATLEDFNRIGVENLDALREVVSESVYLLPADADAEEIMALLRGEGGVKQTMVLRLDGPRMQLALERLGNREDYSVVFYYKTRDGDTRCTLPMSLADCAP